MECERVGAAKRRRERRLRAMLRHERQTVAMELAAALHHSRDVGPGKDDGLRAQKTASSGKRPGVLTEPEAQVGAVTVGYVAAPGPLLCTPLLADTTADGVDTGALAFLTRAALEAQEEEERRVQLAQAKVERREQRVRRQEMVDELAELWRAFLPSQRTPSVERRISELRSSLEASSSSMPSVRRRKKKKRRKKKLPKCGLFPPRCGRPCDHRQVPAVQVVHARESAPASVHRQSGGHSCYACRDVYPQCELCSSSCAVPLPDIGDVGFGSSPYLDTKHTICELCLPSERGCPYSAAPMCCGGICVAMSCGGRGFSPDGAYDSAWYSVRPRTGKYFVNYFQYQEFVECFCMLNYWFSSNDEICADNYIYFRFMLQARVAVRSGSCICTAI